MDRGDRGLANRAADEAAAAQGRPRDNRADEIVRRGAVSAILIASRFHRISDFPKLFLTATPNQWLRLCRPALTRGALAIVTNARRDAVDALASRDERGLKRTAKSCGPDAPTLASSS